MAEIVNETDLSCWEHLLRAIERRKPLLWRCRACGGTWHARPHVQGWNRCPSCGENHPTADMTLVMETQVVE